MSNISPQWTLRRRVIALCLLLAVVLTFLAGGAAATAIANRGEIDTLLTEIGPLRTAANSLSAALVDQETGVRGFVLNGAEAELAPYLTGVREQEDQSAAIASNPSATPEIRDGLARITELVGRWHSTVTEPAIDAVHQGRMDVAESLLGDAARLQFSGIRAAVAELQTTLQYMRDDVVTSIKDTSTTLLFVLFTAAALVIAGAIGLLILLQRTVIAPVTDLAAQVRAVARGSYDHDITVVGPPELELLARDMDSMRQRIAADLAEVRRARRLSRKPT